MILGLPNYGQKPMKYILIYQFIHRNSKILKIDCVIQINPLQDQQ